LTVLRNYGRRAWDTLYVVPKRLLIVRCWNFNKSNKVVKLCGAECTGRT